VGLERERLDVLHQAGLGVLILSLDSPDAAEHDRNRGIPGLFNTVKAAIEQSLSRGLPVVINTVATREKLNNGDLESLRKLALGWGATLNVTIPTPLGRWQGAEEVLLSNEERIRLAGFLKRRGARTDTFSTYLRNGCPAGAEKLSIAVDGEVRPCQLLPISYGNVRDRPLSEIWDRMRQTPALRSYPPFCPAGDREFRSQHPYLIGESESRPDASVQLAPSPSRLRDDPLGSGP
jgi:MoaA/NifB/PqqE/SkfB family radical SAM enzyme